MTIENGVITCKIICYDDKNELLGKEAEEVLLGFCFELSDVACIRQVMNENEELEPNRCTISLFGVHYSINIPYIEMRAEWIKSKKALV